MRLIENVERLWARLAPVTVGSLASVLMPTILCMSFLISTGPHIQKHLVSILASDAPTIYGTAYGESLVKFPNLLEWLQTGTHWLYISGATVIVFLSAYRRGFPGFIIFLGIYAFVFMTILDLSSGLISGDLYPSILIHVAANAIGGVMISSLLCPVLWGFEKIRGLGAELPGALKNGIAAGFVVGYGLSLSTATYFFIYFFYQPVPAHIEVVAKSPIRGGYSNDRPRKGKTNISSTSTIESRPFSAVPQNLDSSKITLQSAQGDVAAVWSGKGDEGAFDIKVDFFANCIGPQEASKIPISNTKISKKAAKSLQINVSPGTTIFEAVAAAYSSISFDRTGLYAIWVNQKEDGSSDVTHFIADPTTLSASGLRTGFYWLSGFLMAKEKEEVRPTSRSFTIIVDGQSQKITFVPDETRRSAVCSPIIARSVISNAPEAVVIVPNNISAIAARVQISRSSALRGANLIRQEPEFALQRVSGLFSVSGFAKDKLSRSGTGASRFADFHSAEMSVEIEGKEVEENVTRLTAIGEFMAHFEQDGDLILSGSSVAMWIDGRRASPTKWERLEIEEKILFLTLLSAIIVGAFKIARPVFSRMKDSRDLLGMR